MSHSPTLYDYKKSLETLFDTKGHLDSTVNVKLSKLISGHVKPLISWQRAKNNESYLKMGHALEEWKGKSLMIFEWDSLNIVSSVVTGRETVNTLAAGSSCTNGTTGSLACLTEPPARPLFPSALRHCTQCSPLASLTAANGVVVAVFFAVVNLDW